MAVSWACKILWGTGIVFVILPHFSLGLLSDYKICGDSECESLMSRVQAIRDHHGKDCRFLSFRRGDTIFVYHKLTGKREDLWAGSIDKQFGYFPKEAVQEELVYAAMEKVVETQKSDFFCMDEFGYPIDSSHLDADADQKNQESETTQTSPYPDDTSAESPSTSVDPSAESPVSAQEADGTLAEEDENRSAGDGGAGTLEGVQETPAALREQGGSAPSSWLGSSVTGWLGLAKEEEAGSLAEGGEKEEGTEMRAEASVASSVTGWLGLGGEGKPDDAVKSREEDTDNADSYTSTMTGWLGFGGETKTAEKERDVEGEDDEEPAERFRSRRMSLDLEGSQLHEEEKKETGTLDWLGSGLSSTLGFGLTNQESGHEATPEREAKETIQEEEEQPASGSWFDVGIGDILGFRKDKKEVDESEGSGFKETEEDKTIEHPTGLENVDTSQSQHALTEEVGTETGNESEVEETPKDQNVPPEIRVNADTNNKDIGTSESSKDRVSPEDSASEIHLEDVSPQTDLEKMRHTEGGMSSMLNSSKEEEEDNVSDDRKKAKSAEMEGEDHQMPKLIECEADVNNIEVGGDKSKTASGNDQDFLTQSGIDFGTNSSSVDLNLNSVEQSVVEVEEDKTEDAVEEGAGIPNQTDNTRESTDAVRIGASSHEGEGNDAETDVLHPEISTTQTDESAEQSQGGGESGGKSQPLLSSGTAEERNEPVSNEDEPLPSHSVETNDDSSDSLTMIDSTETETLQGEIGQEGEAGEGSSQEFESSRSANRSTDSTYKGASEEDRRTLSTNKSATQMENSADQDSVSPQSQQGSTQSVGDAHKLKEAVKETGRDSDKNNLHPVQTETIELEKYILNESGLKSASGSGTETQTEEVESKENEMQGEIEELKGEKTQQEVKEIKEEEKQQEVKEIKEVGKQKEVEEIMKEGKQGEEKEKKEDEKQKEGEKIKEEEKQKEGEKIKEEEKQQEVMEIKEVGKQKEVEEIKEVGKQKEVEEMMKEGKQGEEKEKKEEGKQQEVKEVKEDEKQKEGEQIKEEVKQEGMEELKQKQREKEHSNGEEKKDEMEEMKEKNKQEELKGVEKQDEVKELKEEGKQQRIEELKEEKEKVEELKEVEEKEELKEVEGVKKQETKEGEEKQAQSNFEEEMENSLHSLPWAKKPEDSPEPESDRKETQDENSSDSVFSKPSTQTEKSRPENPQMEEEDREEEKVRGEMKEEVEEMENVERLRRNKEEDMTLTRSNELCSEDRFVRDRDGNDPANMLSSIEEGAMETEQQNPLADDDQILADRTGAIQPVPVEGVEKDEDGIQVEEEKEEKRDDGAMADEGKNNCLPHSGESANPLSLGQTTENTEDDQLHSSEAHNTGVEDSETIRKGVSPQKETEQVHSDHEIVTEEHTDMEEREMNAKHGDFRTDGGVEVPVLSVDPVESPAVISEQTAPSDGHDIGRREPGSGGAFGLFKSTFSFFKSPITETEGSKESAQSLGSDTGETSKVEASLPPEQELDSTTDLSQVYVKDLQPQPSPPVTETRTSPPSPTKTRSHPNESPLQAKTLTEHYKSLLAHMSADEATVLTELFGRHKLQFLDYMLGSTGTMTDGDNSILLDIERLLGHHREALVAPSVRLADAPREDKEKTRTLFALQKLETLLARVRETFSTAGPSCVGESCSTQSEDKETPAEEDSSVGLDSNTPRDEWVELDKEKDGPLSGGTAKERVTEDEERGEEGKTSESHPHIKSASPQPLEGVMSQILDFAHQIGEDSTTHVHAVRELLIWLTVQVVSSLPDDIRPGPDLYGVPWEPVIVSGVVGLVTMLLFTCRCYSSVKSRLYRSKERRMAEQVAQLLDEKCKVLETLSKCQQEYDDLESTLRDSGVLAQTQKTEHLEVKARQLGHAKRELDRDLEQLKDQLDQQRDQRIEQERRIALLEESMKTTEEETRDLQSQDEQAHTTLKVFSMNSDRLQRNLETAGEENALLQESNAQLRQQVEGWAERVSELEAEMSRCEVAHSVMLQDVANKDERLTSLTDRLLRMKAWDSNLEEEEGEEGGEKEKSNGRAEANGKGDVMDTQGHLQKVQKLIYAAKLNADLKAVDEDKDRLFAKLNDEVKAKEELQVSIKELVNEKLSLQSDSGQYEDQVQRLQQKLQIMTEMYQENELKLHRLLTVEEKERMQKQEKLSKADRNIALAMEELSNYRQRAREMEEELEKTKQSYQTQISAHEKKAHNNWLAARAADRELTDIRRENGLFRQKLTDTQFKLEALDKDPYALDSLARPLPFRAERSPYGPSPLGRPASETRAFLSPPTLMDGPPGRLSPRVSRGPVEPPGGQGELDRSGGPHSDSGSISPTWERDRRGPPPGPPGPPGPLGPPGYMFPEPGGPMYRRPPLGALGPLHPRGPPHPADMADGSYRENSHGPGELEHRESGPGDRRTPPEADPRIGGAPPPGPLMGPMGPMGGPFPRRAPYGPPPPDFYPSRGPVGPPMMPMWAPPPPGMMLPPRFPLGGPLAPRPHYAPPMRPPLLDGHPHPSMGPLPPQQSVPSPPHSQSPEEPSSEDAI